MLHTIYDWFELHTIDTITGSLDKMVARLRALADRLHAEVADHTAEAAKVVKDADAKVVELQAQIDTKAAEAAKALATAGKIGALFG